VFKSELEMWGSMIDHVIRRNLHYNWAHYNMILCISVVPYLLSYMR